MNQASVDTVAEVARQPEALFVDLDGTLIASDLLWESLRILIRERPWALLPAPFWLAQGRARLKGEFAARATIHPETLPYRPEVLRHLEEAGRQGRHVVLASASPRPWVEAVAQHLGGFDAVLATDGERNLKAGHKLEAIREYLDERDPHQSAFEYVGDNSADLPIWKAADTVTLAGGSARTRRALERAGIAHDEIEPAAPRESSLRAVIRLMRPYQWVKNALLFVPILLAHQFAQIGQLSHVLIAFATFCGVASGTYILNDVMDVEADRLHPRKRNRPLASGQLPLAAGFVLGPILMALAIAASLLWMPLPSTYMLLGYAVLTLTYTFIFKEKLLLDVMVLAALYTHRVLAGGVAAQVEVSPWLLAFSTFFFLSLALVKRYVELLDAASSNREEISRRAYRVSDLSLVETMGISSGYISVLVLCLFVSSDDVSNLYSRPELLWLMCPVMLYWITRVWMLARRGELNDDPVLFATKDRVSYVAGALLGAIVLGAAL